MSDDVLVVARRSVPGFADVEIHFVPDERRPSRFRVAHRLPTGEWCIRDRADFGFEADLAREVARVRTSEAALADALEGLARAYRGLHRDMGGHDPAHHLSVHPELEAAFAALRAAGRGE